MLTITVLGQEHYDEETNKVTTLGDFTLDFEHSLVALSKWESIHEKPFLVREDKTSEEVMSYIECMLMTPNTSPGVLLKLSEENFEEINRYMNGKKTATWFNETIKPTPSRETITSELIYFWMISYSIPLECERWHLNRLFTLIKVCNAKNQKPTKQNPQQAAQDRAALNAKRKAEAATKG